jgi:uncharacterized integral membrane protein
MLYDLAASKRKPRRLTEPIRYPAPAQEPAQHWFGARAWADGWVTSALSALVLLPLLIFILGNGQRANIGFFGAQGHLRLGIALLLAAILVVILETGRIIQLRMLARRHRTIDANAGTPSQPVPAAQPADPAPGPS